MTAGAAYANDPAATPANSWCVVRSDAEPQCLYDNLVTCGFNAMLVGGQCGKAEWTVVPAATTAAVPPRPRRKPPPQQQQRPQTTAQQNDKLFREFERWKESGK